MAFDPDSSVSYKKYPAAHHALDGNLADEFLAAFIQYACQQADAAAAMNVSTAIAQAKATSLKRSYTF